MSQPMIQMNRTIFLPAESNHLKGLPDARERDVLGMDSPVPDADTPESPESYIRLIDPQLRALPPEDAASCQDAVLLECAVSWHPILDPKSPLENGPVSAPPQCSVPRWWWVAVTCA